MCACVSMQCAQDVLLPLLWCLGLHMFNQLYKGSIVLTGVYFLTNGSLLIHCLPHIVCVLSPTGKNSTSGNPLLSRRGLFSY